MPVPTSISELSTTPGSNPPSGSDSPTVTDDHIRAAYAFIRELSDDKADSDDAVLLTGNQTIAGVKTFSSTPVVPDASFGLAKLANIATARVLGRATAGSGVIEELTAAQIAALIPAASTTASGLVELATDAEAQTGTDATRSVTPDNLGATVIGMGQTWQDVSGSRAFATDYTNSTGRSIQVAVTCTSAFTGASATVSVLVGGVTIATYATNESTGAAYQGNSRPFSFIVPPGAVYRVNQVANTSSIGVWAELR